MNKKSKKEVENINRRVYGNMSLAKLKKIGKDKKGLLNVDHYKNADRNILIERLVKGKQLTDESKGDLLRHAQDTGLKVNASMSKENIIKKITNPELKDLNNLRLRKLAAKKGVKLKQQMTDKAIIERLENPTEWQTIQTLTKIANDNNIRVKRNIKKQDLINLLVESNLITSTPIKAQEANLWVSFKNIPEELRRVVKKKPHNPREEVEDFRKYIKNLNMDYITPSRLKKLSNQLKKKRK